MYLIRTNNAIHTCHNGQLVIVEAPLERTIDYILTWIEEGADGQRERPIAHFSSREEAEDTVDDIWGDWSRDRAVDISY